MPETLGSVDPESHPPQVEERLDRVTLYNAAGHIKSHFGLFNGNVRVSMDIYDGNLRRIPGQRVDDNTQGPREIIISQEEWEDSNKTGFRISEIVDDGERYITKKALGVEQTN